jgi:hypothetical protein
MDKALPFAPNGSFSVSRSTTRAFDAELQRAMDKARPERWHAERGPSEPRHRRIVEAPSSRRHGADKARPIRCDMSAELSHFAEASAANEH